MQIPPADFVFNHPQHRGAGQAGKGMQVVFNNNMEDQMQRNGLALLQLLRSFDDESGVSA